MSQQLRLPSALFAAHPSSESLVHYKHKKKSSIKARQKSSRELAGSHEVITATPTTQVSADIILDTSSLLYDLTASWTALMNISRRGEAHKIEALAVRLLSAHEFDDSRAKLLQSIGIEGEAGQQRAKDGFLPAGLIRRIRDAAPYTSEKEIALELLNGLYQRVKHGHAGLVLDIGGRLEGDVKFKERVEGRV